MATANSGYAEYCLLELAKIKVLANLLGIVRNSA
jgi:hypothetical protein